MSSFPTAMITFLQDLDSEEDPFAFTKYHDDPAILPWEDVPISKEEWEERLRELASTEAE